MMKQGYMVLTYGSDLLTMNEILSFRVSAKASRSFKTDRLTAANANGILKLSNGCTGYSLKDKNKVKPDKTESGIGKSAKTRGQSVLASKEKSPSSLSHRGFKASKLFHQKSPMLIYGDNTPDLGVRHLHFYPLDHLKYGESGQAK
ncbi:hypothetical protein Tco_1507972 [Tanacetum coccineum]